MLFDLKSGKRRRVVQIVFGFLAFIFFISFVGFGIGSDVSGGIFDAIGLGGGDSSGDPQYEQQIEDAEAALETDPNDARRPRRPDRRLPLGSAQSGISTERADRRAGRSARMPTPTSQQAAQAWTDYLATKPKKIVRDHRRQRRPGLRPARRRGRRRRGAGDRRRRPEAPPPPTRSSPSTYTPTARSRRATRPASRRSTPPIRRSASRSRRRSTAYRKQAIKYQEQLEEQASSRAARSRASSSSNDPFGDLGGARRAGHPDAR